MGFGIFLFVLAVVSTIVTAILGVIDDKLSFTTGATCATMFITSVFLGVSIWGEKTPNAIDVYRGRTTLEITYRDSVAVDSVVVWKEETK